MSNVYIMNLKDNSGNGERKNTNYKFKLCLENGLLAIGWCDEKDKSNKNYQNAHNCLYNMNIGDLVWVKNPTSKERYICEISENELIKDLSKRLPGQDMSEGKKCKFVLIQEEDYKNIGYRRLISRPTVRPVKNDLKQITIDLFNKY